MVLLVTLFTYSKGVYILCRCVATCLLLHYWEKAPWTLFTLLMLETEKIKIVFMSETDALQMTALQVQATWFIQRFAVWSYWDWLSGKHFAKSLDIKSVGTATFMPWRSSDSLKLHILLSGEEQEMPGLQWPAPCVLDLGNRWAKGIGRAYFVRPEFIIGNALFWGIRCWINI